MDFDLETRALSCGDLSLKITGDSFNYSIFKGMKAVVKVWNSTWSAQYILDTSLVVIKLPEQGVYNYEVSDFGPSEIVGFKFGDTFSYLNKLIRIVEPSSPMIFCPEAPLRYIPKITNQTGDTLKYEWFENGLLVDSTSFIVLKNFNDLSLKVSAGNCSETKQIPVDSFSPGAGRSSSLKYCQGDSTKLSITNFVRWRYDSDSFYAYAWVGSDIGLVKSDSIFDVALAFRQKPIENITLGLYQRKSNSQCYYVDTLHIELLKQRIYLTDKSVCANQGELDLATLSTNDSLFKIVPSNIAAFVNGLNIKSVLRTDSNAGMVNHYFKTNGTDSGEYTIQYSYTDGVCSAKDSAIIIVRENEVIIPIQTYDKVCFLSGEYSLKQFVNADSGFTIQSISGDSFTNNLADYLVGDSFNTNKKAGVYQMLYSRVNDKQCKQEAPFQLDVLPLPQFSFGADIDVNPFTFISLTAPSNMSIYNWNVVGVGGQTLRKYGRDLNLNLGSNQIICKVTNQNGCTFSDTVVINYSTSIDDLENVPFTIYPNPSKGKFNVRSDEDIELVEVFNSIGQSVKYNWEKQSQRIDMSDLPIGKYAIKLNIGQKSYYSQVTLINIE